MFSGNDRRHIAGISKPHPHPVAASSGGAVRPAWSASTSGSGGGSPPGTPVSEIGLVRLNSVGIHGTPDGIGSEKKKKRVARAVGGDKAGGGGGRGLRQFSMKVCQKVESKGRTTYNEVADELVSEFADPHYNEGSQDQNIRRRVYDALNVLMAMDIISKDKKEIQWKGLPQTSLSDVEELKAECIGLKSRVEKKAAYLQELEEQYVGLQNLIQQNEQLCESGHEPTGGVALPFILVQTRPHATVEVEISEDMQLVHFDFNSTPFKLHDDSFVLKEMMRLSKGGQTNLQEQNPNGESSSVDQQQMFQTMRPTLTSAMITSPPKPGILKSRMKNEL